MDHVINKTSYIIKKNKKKLIFIIVGGLISYYLYKKYLSEKINFLRELYKKISDETKIIQETNFQNLSARYEASFNNLIIRLLQEIKQKFDSEFNLSKIFNLITSAPKEEITKLWIIFKNKNLIYLYCAMFITRLLILLSQTQLLILEKLNTKYNLQPNFLDDLLTELWLLAKNYIDYLLKSIENKLNPIIDFIIINNSYTKDKFMLEINKFRERVEEIIFDKDSNNIHFLILENYFKEIEGKINNLENCTFTNDIKSLKINSFLKFYQIKYDIVTSNLFQVILLKALDNDFNILEDAISLNYENEKKIKNVDTISVPKIINFINKINTQLLDQEQTIFFFKNYKDHKFYEELKEYFKIIYD